jgi:flagellin
VNYTDSDGNVFNDVLRLDSDGNYYMNLPASTTYGAKTATLAVQNDLTNTFYLKTLNGIGAVQIYYTAAMGSSTDASSNYTTLNIRLKFAYVIRRTRWPPSITPLAGRYAPHRVPSPTD